MSHNRKITRRDFLEMGTTAAATAGLLLGPITVGGAAVDNAKPVRIGCVGLGVRGTGLLEVLLGMEGIEIPAVCDVNPAAIARAKTLWPSPGVLNQRHTPKATKISNA